MRRAIFVLGLAAGCGSSSSDTAGDFASSVLHDLSSALSDMATGTRVADMTASTYPPGPYGNMVGDTFPLLMWQGYVDFNEDAVATTKPFGPFSMDGVRTSGRAYAMIHVAEYT